MKLKVLGSGQDGGVPHTGCYCSICNKARENKDYLRMAPSIALYDREKAFCYFIDASPDFKTQLDMLHREISQVERHGKIPVSGILLTHAHMGHYAGLWQLGKETLDEKNVPVYCTSLMRQFLSMSFPFNYLLQAKNIIIHEIQSGIEFELQGFRCTPVEVPHRNEFADTVAYVIQAKKRILYVSDIDYWTDEIFEEIEHADIALIDGTFYSKDELPRFADVPHPPIIGTMKTLRSFNTYIYFTHFNHTNPVNNDGVERKNILDKGFYITHDGLTLEI